MRKLTSMGPLRPEAPGAEVALEEHPSIRWIRAWLAVLRAWWSRPMSPLKIATLVVAALCAGILLKPLPWLGEGSAMRLYYQGALDLSQGHSPYGAALAWSATHTPTDWRNIYMDVYTYPPLLTLVLVPFTVLPLQTVSAMWSLASAGCALYLAAYLMDRLLPDIRGLNRVVALAIIFDIVLLFGPLRHSIRGGQIDIELIVLALVSSVALRTGRSTTSGLLLGLAIAIKPTYVLLLGFHLWRREWRAGAVALASGAMLLAAPFILLPHNVLRDYLSVTAFWNAPGFTMAPKSISLFGVLQRLFFTIPALWRIFAAPLVARAVEALTGLGIYLAASAYVTANEKRGDGQWDYAFGLAILVMLLGSPLTEDAHLSLALLPLGVLCARSIPRFRDHGWVAAVPLALGALFFMYVTLPVRGLATFSSYSGWRALFAGYWFYGLAFLTGLYVWSERRHPGGSPAPSVLAYVWSRVVSVKAYAPAWRSTASIRATLHPLTFLPNQAAFLLCGVCILPQHVRTAEWELMDDFSASGLHLGVHNAVSQWAGRAAARIASGGRDLRLRRGSAREPSTHGAFHEASSTLASSCGLRPLQA